MYLVDLGMSISRYLANKLHDLGLRRQRLFAVARLFSGLWSLRGKGGWATRPHRCCVAAKEGESPSLLYSRIEDEPFCTL
jgi:hypothetical protein